MTTLNQPLKDEYIAYQRAASFAGKTIVSYEMWLEGTLNVERLDLANAQHASHAPDSYRAALEAVDKKLEELQTELQSVLNSEDVAKVRGRKLVTITLTEELHSRLHSIRRTIATALANDSENSS